MPPKSTTYPTPRKASYTPTGSTIAYPIIVLRHRDHFGRRDYCIALEENPTMSQWVSGSKLTFTEEAP